MNNYPIRGQVVGQRLTLEQEMVVSATRSYLTADFKFGPEWDGMSIWAHFDKGNQHWKVNLHDGKVVPDDRLDLTTGYWEVCFHGTAPDGKRITTEPVDLQVRRTNVDEEPLPDIPREPAEQIDIKAQTALNTAKGVERRANEGDFDGGVYSVAVTAEGQTLVFTYTPSKPDMAEIQPQRVKVEVPGVTPEEVAKAVEEYLLKNPVQAPVQSVNSKTGAVVLTAADVQAVGLEQLPEAINTALAQAKASGDFKGDKGDKGDPGKDGAPGRDGKDGADGKDGPPGPQGEPGKDGSAGNASLLPATVPAGLPPETEANTQAVLDALAARPSGGASWETVISKIYPAVTEGIAGIKEDLPKSYRNYRITLSCLDGEQKVNDAWGSVGIDGISTTIAKRVGLRNKTTLQIVTQKGRDFASVQICECRAGLPNATTWEVYCVPYAELASDTIGKVAIGFNKYAGKIQLIVEGM